MLCGTILHRFWNFVAKSFNMSYKLVRKVEDFSAKYIHTLPLKNEETFLYADEPKSAATLLPLNNPSFISFSAAAAETV